MITKHNIRALCLILLSGVYGQNFAGTFLNSCYDLPGVVPPENRPQKGLYVFIDQTMALTPMMKQAVIDQHI